MKKHLLLFFLLVSAGCRIVAQDYGNEWIRNVGYDKTYYRIEVTNEDYFHVNAQTLTQAGLNVAQVQGKYLYLYHNGQSVPIFVSTDGTFGNNDYVEFFGKKNRGELETALYRNAQDQMNPYHSNFSDTASYYLVVRNQPNPLRFTEVVNNINVQPWAPEPYYMYRSLIDPAGMYYPGKYYSQGSTETYKPVYDVAEGYTESQYIPINFNIATPFLYAGGPDAVFKTNFANNSAYPDEHQVTITLNNASQLYTQGTPNTGFQFNQVQTNIPVSQLVATGTNTVSYYDGGVATSQHKGVVGWLTIDYPRTFDFNQAARWYFKLGADVPGTNKQLEISNFDDQGTQAMLLDITNHVFYRSGQVPGTNPVKFNLQPSALEREMFLKSASHLSYYTVTGATAVNFINYLQDQGNYYIITKQNSALTNDGSGNNYVEEYRRYRDQNYGGKYLARVVDIDGLYDQFAYGVRKSPLAIRNFIRFLHDTGQALGNIPLEYVFLIGKGREAPSMRTTSFNPVQTQ